MVNTVLIFVMVRLFETMKITRNKLAGEKTLVFLIYIYIWVVRMRISLKSVINLKSFNDKYLSETM